jgi:hypothetical protein
VRRRDQDVFRRDVRLLLDQPPRLDAHAAVRAEQVADDQGDSCIAVIQHQAARVQLVVDVLSPVRRKAPHDPNAQRRRDVAGRCAGTQLGKRRRGAKKGHTSNKYMQATAHEH